MNHVFETNLYLGYHFWFLQDTQRYLASPMPILQPALFYSIHQSRTQVEKRTDFRLIFTFRHIKLQFSFRFLRLDSLMFQLQETTDHVACWFIWLNNGREIKDKSIKLRKTAQYLSVYGCFKVGVRVRHVWNHSFPIE